GSDYQSVPIAMQAVPANQHRPSAPQRGFIIDYHQVGAVRIATVKSVLMVSRSTPAAILQSISEIHLAQGYPRPITCLIYHAHRVVFRLICGTGLLKSLGSIDCIE